jgi:hypothetical protein
LISLDSHNFTVFFSRDGLYRVRLAVSNDVAGPTSFTFFLYAESLPAGQHVQHAETQRDSGAAIALLTFLIS